MEEVDLINNARRGDLSALEKLLQQNYPILKGYLVKVTLDRELAADLTQETMFKAIKNIRRFKGKSKFSSWLISIGSNLYKDYLKKNRPFLAGDDIERLDSIGEMTDLNLTIQELLEKIPMDKRMVLVLKHYFGYNYAEISKMLNCPVGTVKSRMYYCLEFLQEHIKKGGE